MPHINQPAMLRAMFDLSLDLVGAASLEGRFVTLNEKWEDVLGYALDELEGAEFMGLVHPDDVPATVEAMAQLSEGVPVIAFVNRYRCRDGAYKSIEWRAQPSDDGNIYFVARDISHRVALETRVDDNNRLMREVSGLSGIGYWEVDVVNDTIFWDPVVRAIHEVDDDYSPDLATAVEFYPEDVRDEVNEHVSNAIEKGESWQFELPLITAKGRTVWTRAVGQAVYENGKVVRLQGGFMDITERRAMQAELERRSEAANAASRAKSDFLTNMSHELRTPLHGILGSAQLLETTKLKASQANFVDAIRSSGETLLGLIEDILDLAQIETGKLSLSQKDFCLADMIGIAADSVGYLARAKGVDFQVDIDRNLPLRGQGDPKRLGQVITNFLGNAVKFTPAGRVELKAFAIGQDRLRVEVKDTGPGLSAVDVERIFERFQQVEHTAEVGATGAGLGLAISKEIVELAGGQIGVDSIAGEGATFWFEVPMAFSAHGQAEHNDLSAPSVIERHYKILVVDDVATNRMVASAALKRAGCQIETANDGAAALDWLEVDRFDAVLMDIQMPGMAGDEAIRRIRASEADYSSLPVFVMTADATKDAAHRYAQIGASGYLTKPLRFNEMFDALDAVLAPRSFRRAG
ncbi:ATP-binding protein [Maricaulis sp. CAU 1757]